MGEPVDRKEYLSSQDPKWCPGCGCFPILKAVSGTMAELGIPKEQQAIISGIGCSSRFPYYMDTYGFHTIHGRASTIAMGLKMARPDINVWVVSGDGDALSIGGNHFIHTMRRNADINFLLFNNEIYGLTKGQASPTSGVGTVTKTTPLGSIENPMRAVTLAIATGATFVARVLASDIKGMQSIFKEASSHRGVSMVEIYFNCVTFADGVFDPFSNKATKAEATVELVAGEPLLFGENKSKGFRLNKFKPEVVSISEVDKKDLLVHDPSDLDSTQAFMLSQFQYPQNPLPLGIFRRVNTPVYGDQLQKQAEEAKRKYGQGDMEQLLKGSDFWVVD